MCERQKCNSLHMNTFHTMNHIRYLRYRTHGADGVNWSNRCHRRDGCYGYGGYAAAVGLFHAKRARDSGQCVAV